MGAKFFLGLGAWIFMKKLFEEYSTKTPCSQLQFCNIEIKNKIKHKMAVEVVEAKSSISYESNIRQITRIYNVKEKLIWWKKNDQAPGSVLQSTYEMNSFFETSAWTSTNFICTEIQI